MFGISLVIQVHVRNVGEWWSKNMISMNKKMVGWLVKMYTLRTYWVNAYLKDFFWAGMTTSQMSVSINFFLMGSWMQAQNLLSLSTNMIKLSLLVVDLNLKKTFYVWIVCLLVPHFHMRYKLRSFILGIFLSCFKKNGQL